jgi:hypothetical protein
MKKVNMAERYETSFFKLYNTSAKHVKDEMDKAKADPKYTSRIVRDFVERVIKDAEHETLSS